MRPEPGRRLRRHLSRLSLIGPAILLLGADTPDATPRPAGVRTQVSGTAGTSASAAAPAESVRAAPSPDSSDATPLTESQIALHREAAGRLLVIVEECFAEVAKRIRAGEPITESSVQALIERAYARDRLLAVDRPVVAAGRHSAEPGYETTGETPIRKGDLLLLNLTARRDAPDAVFADVTWMAFVGSRAEISPRIVRVWGMVRLARERVLALWRERLQKGLPVRGEELDEAARRVVRREKHEPWYFHATGHSLGTAPLGTGPNLRRGESRAVIGDSCFALEPGVYYPAEFGVRTEIDVCVRGAELIITSGVPQREIRALLD